MNPLKNSLLNRTVHLISLGCARNRVDSEVMLGGLLKKGWIYTQEEKEAQVIIVNTCGFIDAAKQESVEWILRYADEKKHRPFRLVVTGCLTQRYKNQLVKSLPEVDLFVGTDEFIRLPELLDAESKSKDEKLFARRTSYIYDHSMPRIQTQNPSWAYVKVAEGCQHQCSFCIIPAIRGPLRSRPLESIWEEASQLAANGVKEINLIAQDLAAYGREQGADRLIPLLKGLGEISQLGWIRLLYMYPENISEDFLKLFSTEPKLVPYIDVPVQHASDPLLEKMNRPMTASSLTAVFENLRRKVPNISIRSTVMVGFPGETEDDFHILLDFLKKVKFEHLGCFIYSQEEGTVAARMPDQVDEKTKKRRWNSVMELQKKISREKLMCRMGKEEKMLVTQVNDKDILGRLAYQAPEIDGHVIMKKTAIPLKVGQWARVKLVDCGDYDYVAEFLEMML